EDIRNTPIDFETDNTLRLHGTATFNLNRTVDVFEMTGGTMNIFNTSGGGGSRALRIMSDEANMESTGGNINIFIRRNTQHDIEVPHGILPNLTIHKEEDIGNNGFARLRSPLRIQRDLSLTGFARLNVNTQNYNVSVGRNFSLGPDAVYIPRQNTTIFNGHQNGIFSVDGEIADGLYNLTVQKSENRSLIIDGENGDIFVRRLLSLQSGFLNDGGKTITVQRDIFNSAQHTGSGRILLSGASVNRVIDGDGNGEFGNLELDDSPLLTTTLAASQKVNGNFTLTNGILHLANNELRLESELLPSDPLHYNASRMIMTAGNTSDAGLIFRIDENRDYLFPLGTDRDDMTRYTPAIATISDFAEEGYLRVNPVGHELPTLNQESDSLALQYFWRIRNEGFDSSPNVAWVFHYDENDVPVEDHLGNPVENADENFIPGKVVGAIRSFEESGVDASLKTITFPPHALVNGSYTAAEKEKFEGQVPVFYSRLPDSQWYNHYWDQVSKWSNVSHDPSAPQASRIPGPGDIVYIGYWDFASGNRLHSMNIRNGTTAECAELIILKNPAAGTGSSRLVMRESSSANFDVIKGTGTFQMDMNASNVPNVNADFGEFVQGETNMFIYRMVGNGTMTIPAHITTYPNLRFEAGNNSNLANRIALVNENIHVLGNLNIDWGARLQMGPGFSGTFRVDETTFLGTDGGTITAGSLEFPTGSEWTFETSALILRSNANNRVMVHNNSDALLHRLQIKGNGISMANGTFNLFNNNTGGNNAELIFTGEEDASFIRTGGNIPRLFNLILDKGNNQTPLLRMQTDFTLHAPTDIAQKPIQLRNGTLMLEHEDINLQMSTGGGLWQVPANAALVVNQGRVNLTANGINLRGKLRVENEGGLIMGGQNNNRIVIQYEGLTPELELAGNGRIEVNSQIRRPTNTTNGSLRYRQHGGLMIIHGARTQNSRARLEITNTGSEFAMSDGQIIIRRGSGNIFGDLFLNAQSFSVTGGDIWLSQGEVPAQGGFDAYPAINAHYNYRVSASGFLHNLFIGSDEDHNRRATAVLWSQPLRINNELVFRNDLSQISTANRDVEIKGDLHFRGSWLHENSETVSFTGIDQSLYGSPEFNHMRVSTTGALSLQPDASPVIHGNLMLDQGQLVDGGNAIWVRGDVINNATLITSDPANFNSGLKLTGETTQRISGNGVFGLLEMDNVMGVNLFNDIHLNNHLILTRGIFNIGSNLLSLGLDANIISFDIFSAENMILTDGIFGNEGGIRKSLSGAATGFVFPIGVYGKYTPVDLSVFEADSPGHVLVKPINDFHPTTMDPENVLQYYWYMESEGLDGFAGEAIMHYLDSDVRGDEENYLATRLRENIWQKFQNEAGFIYVDTDAKTIRFLFEDDNLSGEYSAGIDEAFTDSILTFTSVKSGEWTDLDLWARSDGGEVTFIPAGVNIVISEGDTVLTGGNRRQAYTVTINGRLEIGQTFGHNFGTVAGGGTLSSGRNILPAGKYSGFFNTPGNTMEYTGPLSFTIIPDYTTQFQNLTIAGSGLKRLPNQFINILGNLRVEGNARLGANNSQTVNLSGNLVKEDEARLNFDLHQMQLNMTGSSVQLISGNFQAAGNHFHTLSINNPAGVTIEGNVDIAGTLNLNNGIVNTHNAQLRLNWANNGAIGAYSNQSFIDGPLTRRLAFGMNNLFPVGNNGVIREIRILQPSLNDLYWTAEYFNEENINDPDLMDTGQLSWVNANEYWKVDGPNGAQAQIQLTAVMDDTYPWFEHPQLPEYLHVAEWSGVQWISRGQLQHSVMAGNRISVTAQSFSPFSTRYFTLGQSADVDGALPIELLSFTATAKENMVLLEWITAAEINNDFFTIERSRDGRNFEIVAVIASQAEGGFSNQELYYTAWDIKPEMGINYYRLKQTDFDGSFEYSDIVGVFFELQSNVAFNLFPNPNSGNAFTVNLSGLRPYENIDLSIVDMFGKIVFNSPFRADDNGGLHRYIVPSGRLKSGVYMVTLTGNSGKFTLRMVVN
ncbi:MAG: T9SS C-terminal target domain-containing protein, partial [Bacteroidetes bacterium]